jgi:SAM-dependent methyltransferase
VARGWLRGRGLEIGALDAPFPLPSSAAATYVDRLPVAELRHHYPEIAADALVAVDVVDDAETLQTIASSSQDFVIASHVLEHCEDALAALASWVRVLKPGGAAVVVVPDKRFTFDAGRPTTSLAHLVADHAEGAGRSREQHYLEWVTLVEGVAADRARQRAGELQQSGYRIHFHVWDLAAFAELLAHCAGPGGLPARVARLSRNRSENVALLVKTRDA